MLTTIFSHLAGVMTDIDDPPSTNVHIHHVCYNAKDTEENNGAQVVACIVILMFR